ncbi:MAG: hypothetical protein ACREOE_18470, partial [Gemmatimonadales bacterium]
MVAIAALKPTMCRYWASRDSRYWSSLPPMIALAHRALDPAVNAALRVLSRSLRACRLAPPSNA